MRKVLLFLLLGVSTLSAQFSTLGSGWGGGGATELTDLTDVTAKSGTSTTVVMSDGNAATATALAANGANCASGNYPLGVDASGAAESCTAVTSFDPTLYGNTSWGGDAAFTWKFLSNPSSNIGMIEFASDGAINFMNGDRSTAGTRVFQISSSALTGGIFTGVPSLKGNAEGTVTAPAYAFRGDTNLGFYRIGADNMAASVGGVKFTEWGGAQTFQVQNTTATTGNTTFIVKEGAGQSSPAFQILENGGTVLLSVASGGGLIINDGGTKPTCEVATRFMFWAEENGGGVKDTVEICAKAANDTYDWRNIY